MRIPIILALLALLGCAEAQQTDQAGPESCRADVFVPESLKQSRAIVSPDGRFQVVLDEYREEKDLERGRLSVLRGKALLGRYRLRGLSAGIFVKWSLDSRAFYVMWSSGGMIGTYDVRVFSVSAGTVREVFPTRIARREFKRTHNCPTRSTNVFAIKWSANSERLMIATQVYPTGDCGKELGVTGGYVVRLEDGAILDRFSQETTENEMRQCPTVIWPTGLWNEDDLQKAKASVAAKGQ
jgi:hypothetical protein